MTTYRKDFDETKYVSFLIKMINYWKNTMKLGIKSVILSEMNLIVIRDTRKNI